MLPNSKYISQNLKMMRQKTGLSQKETAEMANVNYRHYQEIESGRVDVRHSTVVELAKVFRIPQCYLYRDQVHTQNLGESILCPLEILDRVPNGILLFNRDGQILYSNEFFHQNLSCFSRDHFYERKFYVWDLLIDDIVIRTQARAAFKKVQELAPDPRPAVWTYKGPEFVSIEVFVTWDYLKNAKGEVVNYVAALFPRDLVNVEIASSVELSAGQQNVQLAKKIESYRP